MVYLVSYDMAGFCGLVALPTVSALICAHNATHSSQMKTHGGHPSVAARSFVKLGLADPRNGEAKGNGGGVLRNALAGAPGGEELCNFRPTAVFLRSLFWGKKGKE